MNGIVFKKLIIKNFLSFGPNPTEINLTGNYITMVMGLNHDAGGDESRNGAGKSAILDGISYNLFGKTVRGISNSKLVNKMARKGQGMLTVLELDAPSGAYRIERGESPSKLRVFRKELDDTNDFMLRDGKTYVYDISRNKVESNADIEEIIGFDIKLFEYLMVNSSETIPFMKLKEDEKRAIAERLMGLNLLTTRAKELGEDRKQLKKDLIAMESAVEATRQANRRVTQQLDNLKSKESAWENKHQSDMDNLRKQIESLSGVDVAEQIEILEMIDQVEQDTTANASNRRAVNLELRQSKRDLSDLEKLVHEASKRLVDLTDQQSMLDQNECPTCHQHWVADPELMASISGEIEELSNVPHETNDLINATSAEIAVHEDKLGQLEQEETELEETVTELSTFDLIFDSIDDAKAANTNLDQMEKKLTELEQDENPHSDTIHDMKENALEDIDDSEVKDLSKNIAHFNYLIDLLQNKDSFLRKAVIDRWLPQLNNRIAHYLSILELQFQVRIENDLTMSITDFGEDFDWGNLSKGQRQRVTISLNLAFQDLFEATNHPLSLLCIDELLDNGICNRGAQQALQALRDTCKNKDKRVLLVSHRMDIADQIDDVMLIELKNRISRIEEDDYE